MEEAGQKVGGAECGERGRHQRQEAGEGPASAATKQAGHERGDRDGAHEYRQHPQTRCMLARMSRGERDRITHDFAGQVRREQANQGGKAGCVDVARDRAQQRRVQIHARAGHDTADGMTRNDARARRWIESRLRGAHIGLLLGGVSRVGIAEWKHATRLNGQPVSDLRFGCSAGDGVRRHSPTTPKNSTTWPPSPE